MGELVVASEGELQCDAEGLDGHDGDGPDSRANREVDQCVLLAVLGRNLIYHDDGEDDNQTGVEKEGLSRRVS